MRSPLIRLLPCLFGGVVVGKWYKGHVVGKVGYHRRVSSVWDEILEVESVVECSIQLWVGCGNWYRFWEDHWVDSMPLRLRFPGLFMLFVMLATSIREFL